jgi:hypothetical protein
LRASPKLENAFLTLIQENECFVLKRKCENFGFFLELTLRRSSNHIIAPQYEHTQLGGPIFRYVKKEGSAQLIAVIYIIYHITQILWRLIDIIGYNRYTINRRYVRCYKHLSTMTIKRVI